MKTSKQATLCLLSAALLAVGGISAFAQDPATAIYVSPTGDDANPGTQQQPIRTLEHARDLVRAKNHDMQGDMVVNLSGGTYRLAQPLTFTPADSGANGHDVIYRALPGQAVVVSGGLAVTGWTLADAKRNLWSAPAPAGLVNTRQMYVDGVRAPRTRGRLPVTLTETATGYTAGSAAMASWRNPSDIEFVYTGGNGVWSEGSFGLGAWTEPRCPIASISSSTITMAQPCFDNSTKRVMLPNVRRTANLVGPAAFGKRPASVENAYELLGTPGQWYFDRSAHVIYYVPRTGEDMTKADVEVPVLETLVSGEGTTDNPVHNIVFSGLQFSYATWLAPSSNEGFSEIQATYRVTGPDGYARQALGALAPDGTQPYGAWTKTPGNVSFAHAGNIRFQNDAFVHLGAAGLDLGNGSQSNVVEGCVFTDISANGLEIGAVDLPQATGGDITRDNRVTNNHFYNVATEFHGGVGIDVGYAQRTTIRHNQLDHLPYTGISLGWGGWPDKIGKPGLTNFSQGNVVADNLIFNHMLILADGGGIYTQGLTGATLADGEKIDGNVIRDQFGSGHGIYTDNGSCNITITNNVMFHTNFDNWGSRHKDYYDGSDGSAFDPITVTGNYWQQGGADASEKNITLKNNRLIDSLDQVPAAIVQNAGLEPAYRSLLDKQFGAPSAPEPPCRVAAANAGGGIAYVTWNPSVYEGGAPVESYTVTASSGQTASISADDFRTNGYLELSGLSLGSNGATGFDYTFTVTARNANGESPRSLPSRTITLAAASARKPDAPAVASAILGDGRASIHFQSPEDDGGSPVVAYTVTVQPGGRKVTFTGRSVVTLSGKHTMFGVVNGLDAGKQYTFAVAAVNAAGEGAAKTTRVRGGGGEQAAAR